MSNLTNALLQLRAERPEAQSQVEKLDKAIAVIESLNGSGPTGKTSHPTRVISAASHGSNRDTRVERVPRCSKKAWLSRAQEAAHFKSASTSRAVCESFSTATGSLSIEVLRKEADIARAAFLRLEPEYGRFLANLAVWEKPGRLPVISPRTAFRLDRVRNRL